MARSGLSGAALQRLVSSAAAAMYVIDAAGRVVYANQGLLDWLGTTADQLIGQRLAYHAIAPEDPRDVFPHGLCPPPHLVGWGAGTVFRATSDGGRESRWAWWIPLDESRTADGDGSGTDDSGGGGGGGQYRLGIVLPPGGLPHGSSGPAIEPSEAEELHAALAELRESLAKQFGWQRLVGDSPVMRRVRRQVRLAADTGCATLVCGPVGSGREHVARTIHFADARWRLRPLVPLACPMLDPELLKSTIDGIVQQPDGLATAGPATLLLLDVDGLSDACQIQLLDRLREHEGHLRTLATALSPQLGGTGRSGFLPALAAQLSTLVIEIAPLGQRRQDVPPLAQALVEQWNATEPKQFTGLTTEAIDRLVMYHWPRGADELAETIRQAAQAATDPWIEATDLPDRLTVVEQAARVPREPEVRPGLDELMISTERQAIEDALRRAKGNKSRAAKLLRISRARLIRRAQQLGLDGES